MYSDCLNLFDYHTFVMDTLLLYIVTKARIKYPELTANCLNLNIFEPGIPQLYTLGIIQFKEASPKLKIPKHFEIQMTICATID